MYLDMTLEHGVPAVLVGTPTGAFPELLVVVLLSGCVFIWFGPIGMSAGKEDPSPPAEELLGATRSEDESGCIIITIYQLKRNTQPNARQTQQYYKEAIRALFCRIMIECLLSVGLAIARVSPLALTRRKLVHP